MMPRPENPLDKANGLLAGFAGDLRRLRDQAGGPSYRALAKRAHYSAATLADAASGRRLPTLAVTVAYVLACGGQRAEWEQRWRAVAAELVRDEPVRDAGVDGPAPYVGLAAFQTEDADRFFGREQLIDEVWARLRERRCVAAVGASGCGKSSLLRAGVVPRFASGSSVVFTPGPHPLEACAAQLAPRTGGSAHQVHADLVDHPRALHRTVLQALADRPAGDEMLIVVDQFEEVFTLCRDPQERIRFIDALVTAAQANTSRARVVLGLRSDFYPHCADYPDLFAVLNGAQVLVGAMSAEQLRRAITQPAIETGCTVETTLLATLLSEAAGQPGVLPLVSHALLQTWHRRRGNTLSLDGYRAAGGIRGALAQTADEVYAALDTGEQCLARQLFLRLTALGEGTEDTKRRITRDELDPASLGYDTILGRLAQARLITLDNGSIEITHESLIKAWPRLHGWLTEDRDGLRTHRQLTDAATTWESLHRDPSILYRGTRLAVAQDWAAGNDDALTPREREFLDASTNGEHQERRTTRRRIRQLRSLTAGLTVLLVITASLAVVTRHQQQQTAQQRQIALSRQFAAQADAVANYDVGQAIRWSLEGYHHYPTAQARSSLLSLASHTAYHGFIAEPDGNPSAPQLSEDGRRLVTTLPLGRVAIYDVSQRTRIGELALNGTDNDPNADIATTALSPDGQRLIHTFGIDDSMYMWDLTKRIQIAKLQTPGRGITDVAFSPDGTQIASIDTHGTVTLWDSTTLRQTTSWPGNVKYDMFEVVFSPNGKILATIGSGHVILRDLTTGQAHLLARVYSHPLALTFSPDSKIVAIANDDVSTGIRLWDTGERNQTVHLMDDAPWNAGVAIAFNKYGDLIAAGGDTMTIWSFREGRVINHRGRKIPIHPGRRLGQLASGSDGTIAATTRHGIELWDSSRLPILMPDRIGPVFFHPNRDSLLATDYLNLNSIFEWDGRHDRSPTSRDLGVSVEAEFSLNNPAISMSSDGSTLTLLANRESIAIIDTENATVKTKLPAPKLDTADEYVRAISPHGDRIVMSNDRTSVTVWDVREQRSLATIPIPSQEARIRIAMSREHVAVYAGRDTHITVWDIDMQTTIAELSSEMNLPQHVIYSPDGRLMAAVNPGGTVTLWDTSNYSRITTLSSRASDITSVAFSRDSRLLAVASTDGTLSIWDTTTREQWATVTGPAGNIHALTWNYDGTTLAGTVAAIDGSTTATTWTTNVEQATRHLCHTLTHNFPANADPLPAACPPLQQTN